MPQADRFHKPWKWVDSNLNITATEFVSRYCVNRGKGVNNCLVCPSGSVEAGTDVNTRSDPLRAGMVQEFRRFSESQNEITSRDIDRKHNRLYGALRCRSCVVPVASYVYEAPYH